MTTLLQQTQINGHISVVKHRKKKTNLIEQLDMCQQGTTILMRTLPTNLANLVD